MILFFVLEFRDKHHLEYKLSNPLYLFYAYCFAPDHSAIDLLIYQNHMEISGTYIYLEALIDDPYINTVITEQQKKNKDKAV